MNRTTILYFLFLSYIFTVLLLYYTHWISFSPFCILLGCCAIYVMHLQWKRFSPIFFMQYHTYQRVLDVFIIQDICCITTKDAVFFVRDNRRFWSKISTKDTVIYDDDSMTINHYVFHDFELQKSS